MNIVFFYHRPLFPIESGGSNRVFGLAKTLSDMGENVYVIQNSRDEGIDKFDNLSVVNCPFIKAGKFSKLLSWMNLIREFKRLNDRERIDIIQCEFPFIFPVVYLTKLFSNIPIVLDAHVVERDLVRQSFFEANRFVKLGYLLTEYLGVKLASHIFTVSKIDLQRISKIYKVPVQKLTTIPIGVGEDFFQEFEPYKFEKPSVLFVGYLPHKPNYYAAKLLNDEIIPRVTMKERNAQFVFVGKDPPSWLKNGDHIKVMGFVPDLRPYIRGADVCVAPISDGTGMRSKILDYMAMGKPVVSTTAAAQGIDGLNQENIIIEDDIEKFSEQIVSLLRDKKKGNSLGENAKRLIKENYTWERVCQKALEVYKKLC